jgi:ATP-dependent Lhr-like helicase
MGFDLLSQPIKKYIRDKGWSELRPIQNAAISRILTTNNHYILASRTASGKTEAAFLPILSKVDFDEMGVQVLYVSPLVALINDQFNRVEELCENLDVRVTKWHGEAKVSLKKQLVKQPSGIVLITPESLEAMFVNKPYQIKSLFFNLKFVVIDEIHAFIGTDRGIQLKSILSRLQDINQNKFRVIGLSATIGKTAYNEAKAFTGDIEKTKILVDKTKKPINVNFKYFESESTQLPLALLKDLYLTTKNDKVLIFPNSRGRVEEVAVKLKKISDRVNGHKNYYSHHSSVHKDVREYVEFFAKNNEYESFCIACTSTLELGIDIGTVNTVVQIDATHSIASLIQRVGRSGRKDGQKGNLFLYATHSWALLQALACWLLYQEDFIDPPTIKTKPYDILVHQALSIAKGSSGVLINSLVQQLLNNFAFKNIDEVEIREIISHLIKNDWLEQLRHEVIIGIEGEKIVNSRDFYSVFQVEETFKFQHIGKTIGEIPFSIQIRENENILLAARIWKITYVDFKARKVIIIPAKDGKPPLFFGGARDVHETIRQKMFDIILDNSTFEYFDEKSQDEIEKLRNDFSCFNIQNTAEQRPLLSSEGKLEFYTFTGTRTNNTLKMLFDLAGIHSILNDTESVFYFDMSKDEFKLLWSDLKELLPDIDSNIAKVLIQSPDIINFSKWGEYLPLKYQAILLEKQFYDVKNTKLFFEQTFFIDNK